MKYASFDSYQIISQRPFREDTDSYVTAYGARRFRLHPVDFLEQFLQLLLEGFVFRALVELADEVATSLQDIEAEK